MRLLTWNLNGRRSVDRQVTAIASRAPDIVALQEITYRSAALHRVALAAVGLAHIVDSFSHSAPWERVGPRRYGLLIASIHPLTPLPSTARVPWPERLLSADIATPSGLLTIHTTHIPPGSSNGPRKIDMLEALTSVVAEPSPTPRILCGDFNVPQAELPNGRIVTWAERLTVGGEPRPRVTWRKRDARQWDAAERTVMEGGPQRALVDAYRALHGYARQEFSWILKRKALRVGRRFDHAFCSREIRISRCEYLHDVRERGLSDHAALELDFEL